MPEQNSANKPQGSKSLGSIEKYYPGLNPIQIEALKGLVKGVSQTTQQAATISLQRGVPFQQVVQSGIQQITGENPTQQMATQLQNDLSSGSLPSFSEPTGMMAGLIPSMIENARQGKFSFQRLPQQKITSGTDALEMLSKYAQIQKAPLEVKNLGVQIKRSEQEYEQNIPENKYEMLRQEEIAKAKGKATGEQISTAQKAGVAIRRLNVLNKQFNEALPTGKVLPWQQRFVGPAKVFAAKRGIEPNPKLVAIMTNSRPIAINLMRTFGEVGNLSETEQKSAIDIVERQPGLTEVERLALAAQFAEYALAGATPEAIQFLIEQKDVMEIASSLGIKIPGRDMNDVQQTTNQSSNANKEAEDFLKKMGF